MTENEQIQEMARLMEEPCVGSCKACEYYPPQCDIPCDIPCMNLKRAKIIYAKGYRKVERGHWITEEEEELMYEKGPPYDQPEKDHCSACGHCDWDNAESRCFNFCPYCGAKKASL